jgi:hypothetical protein
MKNIDLYVFKRNYIIFFFLTSRCLRDAIDTENKTSQSRRKLKATRKKMMQVASDVIIKLKLIKSHFHLFVLFR